jgi:two-component system chemotaxis response regulator CheB
LKNKVLVAESSLEFRMAIKNVIQKTSSFELHGTLLREEDLYAKLTDKDASLLILDADFGGKRGLEILKKSVEIRKVPIIFVSTDYKDSSLAYENGAALFLLKTHPAEPITMFEKRFGGVLKQILPQVKESGSKTTDSLRFEMGHIEPKYHPDELLRSKPAETAGKKIIAIGASTGGVEALSKILTKLPVGLPPILVVQHIPLAFSKNFVSRLDMLSKVSVVEAKDGEHLKDSTIYFAPGDSHLAVERARGGGYIAKIIDGVKISRHRPSVDMLFRSVNNAAGGGAMAVIMTGMGDDGAICMRELFDSGAYTVAQSESSSVVFGMAASAIKGGAIRKIVDLDDIPTEIVSFSNGFESKK